MRYPDSYNRESFAGVIGVHDLLRQLLDVLPVGIRRFHQIDEFVEEDVVIDLNRHADMDQIVVRLSQSFLLHEFFLIQLFAGAQSRKGDSISAPTR